jgi:diguanylate cyclase (GGDEF)-like protein/PAS domain S-box-containing protein
MVKSLRNWILEHKPLLTIVLITVSAALIFDIILYLLLSDHYLQKQKELAFRHVAEKRILIEEEMVHNIHLISGMAAYIKTEGSVTPLQFNKMAMALLEQPNTLRNIAIAPNLIIGQVYPYKGNEAVIGLNYRTKAPQWQDVSKAIETRKIIVAGPIPLVQGGKGLAIRIPVFRNGTLWGVVSSVIDFDRLLSKIFNSEYDKGNYDYAIYKTTDTGKKGTILYGSQELYNETEASLPITFPGGNWAITIRPSKGWIHHPPYLNIIYLITSGITFIIILLLLKSFEIRQSIRESENQLRAMSKAVLDPLVIINAHDQITFWNLAAEKLFGYTEEEAKNYKLHDIIVHEPDRIKAKEGLKTFAHTGDGPIMQKVREVTAIKKGGISFSGELSVSSFKLKDMWYAVGTIRDITDRKEFEKELTNMATTDPLTALFNRRKFLEIAGELFDKSMRNIRSFSILMFDLDHFKRVNDTYGHDAGDEVLKKTASTVSALLRKNDYLGRIGGEEFAIIFYDSTLDMITKVGERIRKAVEEMEIEKYPEIHITTSIGISQRGEKHPTFHTIIKNADKALYMAKKEGRNRVKIYLEDQATEH